MNSHLQKNRISHKSVDFNMKSFFKYILWTLLFPAFAMVPSASAWDCDVSISGPSAIKKDQTITLEASGNPSAGSYSWWRIPNLIPNGNTAYLTGFEPTFSEYIRVGVTYTTPRGKKCSNVKYLWYEDCCAIIQGGDTVSVEETIILSASGVPLEGSFIWENSNPQSVLLEPSGNTAILTGLTQGTTTITLTYAYPGSNSTCQTTHEVTVTETCNINLAGTLALAVGQYGSVFAETTPEGGELIWTMHPNIQSINDDSIYHTSEIPGIHIYEAKYVLPDGNSCSTSFDATFVKVDSVIGPYCVDSGTTLFKSDFDIITNPEGFNLMVNVSPLNYLTNDAFTDETITASIASGLLDSTTTTLRVINSDKKFNAGIEISMPNYVSEPLKTLGLSDKLDMKIKSNFDRFWECCSESAILSVEGSTNIDLEVSGGPFTIVGIPLPKKLREFVSLDVLKVDLSCGGSVKIKGNHQGCHNITDWSGGGTLSAEVKIGGEAKAKTPDAIVLHGQLNGKTGISQSITAQGGNLLVSSEWEGLELIGVVKFDFYGYTIFGSIKHPLIDKNEMPQVLLSLPSLK